MEDKFILNNVSRDLVIEMLTFEQKIRYSKEIQDIYTMQYNASKDKNYEPINIERAIQQYVLKRFGFESDMSSLEEYWKIPSTYWDDEEVKNSIFYMKLNIFQFPSIKKGDNMIDANLVNYETNEELMLSSLQTNKPLVILAGSMT
jgi:hypothetical protein